MMRRRTNFDLYLQEQLKDPDFAERFRKAGEAWDVAVQLASLREEAGLSQKQLARKVGTSQQQISRLESPSYEGHTLGMLRRVARALGAAVHVDIRSRGRNSDHIVAEARARYGVKRRRPVRR
jgi:transcriptional regulator with XRE-family HTH domain